jgi:hypothetical protein
MSAKTGRPKKGEAKEVYCQRLSKKAIARIKELAALWNTTESKAIEHVVIEYIPDGSAPVPKDAIRLISMSKRAASDPEVASAKRILKFFRGGAPILKPSAKSL